MRKIFSPSVLIVFAAILSALFLGLFSVIFMGSVGGKLSFLLALPAAMVIGLLFVFNRYALFFLVIIFRSAMDLVFDNTKLGGFGLGAVLNAMVILIAVIGILQDKGEVKRLLVQTWLPFLIIVFGTIFISPESMTAVKSFLSFVSYAAVFALAIILIKSEDDYVKWMRAVFLSSLIPVAYAFVDIATGGYSGTQESEGFRINSTFSHPNIFAFYLVLLTSITFYFYKSKTNYVSKTVRRMLPLYILIMLALLVLTKTRSAWAAAFFFFMLYGLFYERKYLLFICLAPLVGMMIPEVRDRFMDLAQGNEAINYAKLNSYAWRKLLWQSAIDWMKPAYYLFGYGLESFRAFSPTFFLIEGGTRASIPAHSVYVQLFFETGALGLLSYFWLNYRVGRILIPFYKKNKLMIFSAIMFLLEFALGAYSDNMLSYLSFNWYLWFVLGAAYAVNNLKRDQIKNDTAIST